MKKNNTIRLFIILVFVVPLLAFGFVSWFTSRYSQLPVLGPVKKEGSLNIEHTVNEFNLINQDKKNKGSANWKDKIVIADFFFTHCPVICPRMTQNLKKVQQAFKGDNEILFNSISVDPERDSTEQLKNYSRRMKIDNNNWDLLTGDKKEIYRLARNSFLIVATDGDGGSSDFIHSEKLVLIDKKKRIRGYYKGTDENETKQLIRDIQKLKNEN